MSRSVAIWLSLALVCIHNVEELLGMGSALALHRDLLPAFLQSMTAGRFGVSLIMATAICLAATWAGARSASNGPWLTFFVAYQVSMALNALQHCAIAAWVRGYAPGVITALALVGPYAVYLVRRAVREKWIAVRPLVLTAAALLVAMPGIFAALHAISSLVL